MLKNTYTPKWFYIKESPTGLMYLGQTIRKDVYSYRGSGTYWLRHLKKYKCKTPPTIFARFCQTPEEFQSLLNLIETEYGEYWNDRDNWANLRAEDPYVNGAWSDEWKASRRGERPHMSGQNNPMYGKDWRVGKSTDELALHADRCGAANKGVSRSEAFKENLRKPRDINICDKISKTLKGRKRAPTHSEAISIALKNKPKIECPHCSLKIAGNGNYKRWHGDNCKTRSLLC